jgi:TfoX/Sxy family transcriptional regulator of competence genes
MTQEERFAAIVGELLYYPDVIPLSDDSRKSFGSSGLKVHNKIFAMLVRGNLVVKLPKQRVDALVTSGDGERFDPRHDGRLMKEWLVLDPASTEDWLSLAKEAMEFVASKS